MFYRGEQKNIIGMLFPGNPEFHSLLGEIGSFCEKEIIPHAKKIDQEEIFPRENLRKLADKGVFAISFPSQYGGKGLPFPVSVAAVEMLARACANTSLQVSVQGMICEGLRLFCNEPQRSQFLKEEGLSSGKKLIAFALTEPCCGSDAKSIQTKAVSTGGSYKIHGSKMMITNAGEADFTLVFAKTEKGISAFIVPAGTPGFKIMKTIPKLGCRGNRLVAIHFEDCSVPAANLVGQEGKGLEYAKQILNFGRITIGAVGVGIAQAAFDKAVEYSKRRKAFGASIANFQLVQDKIADMATEIQAARLLVYYAAFLKHMGQDLSLDASRAKLFSSEMALRVCDLAIQIHGGYGYTDAYDVHRHWRDARLLTLGEGTSDMLRLLIAHLSLKETE